MTNQVLPNTPCIIVALCV